MKKRSRALNRRFRFFSFLPSRACASPEALQFKFQTRFRAIMLTGISNPSDLESQHPLCRISIYKPAMADERERWDGSRYIFGLIHSGRYDRNVERTVDAEEGRKVHKAGSGYIFAVSASNTLILYSFTPTTHALQPQKTIPHPHSMASPHPSLPPLPPEPFTSPTSDSS